MSVLSSGLSYGVDSVVDPHFLRTRIWIQPEISMHPDPNPYSRVNGGNKVEEKKKNFSISHFIHHITVVCGHDVYFVFGKIVLDF
jgi:hypothetical protein